MANTRTTELHCPPEWAEAINLAMATALPTARTAGPDSVRVGILVRQSKAREDESQGSPRMQLDAGLHTIQSPAHANWHVSPENVYADIGVSGWSHSVKRPGYEAMMQDVQDGKLDVIIVYALSRLSRKGALDVLTVIDVFAKNGVRLVSVTEPWLDTDPANPVGQAILGLTAALAQQESAQKSEFITDAHATARKRGGHVSGRAPYGMTIERVMVDGVVVNKLVPHPETAQNVRLMVEWVRKDKLDRREIASRLTEKNIPTPTGKATWIVSTVRAILRDPRLAGYSVEAATRVGKDADGNKKRQAVTTDHQIMYGSDGTPVELHKGIITRAEWWELQTEQGRDASETRLRDDRHLEAPKSLFARLGILRCFVCGRPMTYNPGSGTSKAYPFYTCNTGPGGPKNAPKHSQGISASTVDRLIAEGALRRLANLDPADPEDQEILAYVADRFARQHETPERTEQRVAAEKERTHVQAALRTLAADREDGDYDSPTMKAIYKDSLRRLVATEARLSATIAELTGPKPGSIALPAEWLVELDGDPIGPDSDWAAWTLERRREFISAVVGRVDVVPAGKKGSTLPVAKRLETTWAKAPQPVG